MKHLRILLSLLPILVAVIAYNAAVQRPALAGVSSACLTGLGLAIPLLMDMHLRLRLFPTFMNGFGGSIIYIVSTSCWLLAGLYLPAPVSQVETIFGIVACLIGLLATGLLVWETYDNRYFKAKTS